MTLTEREKSVTTNAALRSVFECLMAVKKITTESNAACDAAQRNFSRVPEDFREGLEFTRDIYKEMGCLLEKFGVRWQNYDKIQKLLDEN